MNSYAHFFLHTPLRMILFLLQNCQCDTDITMNHWPTMKQNNYFAKLMFWAFQQLNKRRPFCSVSPFTPCLFHPQGNFFNSLERSEAPVLFHSIHNRAKQKKQRENRYGTASTFVSIAERLVRRDQSEAENGLVNNSYNLRLLYIVHGVKI